jgi:hypothetical protein
VGGLKTEKGTYCVEIKSDGSVEKLLIFRLVKNAQMQGSSFDRLRINSPEE